ncbi:MAG: transposase [Actinobacteria bacterium]|nr:transposase [Actinomycetota bacterium]
MRLVFEQEKDYPSQWSAIASIAQKSGVTPETLRKWVRQAERDGGRRPGLGTDERERLRGLEKENKELRRANEILKAASSSSRGSSTRDFHDDRVHRRAPMQMGGVEPIRTIITRPLRKRPSEVTDLILSR